MASTGSVDYTALVQKIKPFFEGLNPLQTSILIQALFESLQKDN